MTTVAFHHHGKKGTLYVDDVLVAEGSSNGNTLDIKVIPPIYVGGVSPEILTKASRNFEVTFHALHTPNSERILRQIY